MDTSQAKTKTTHDAPTADFLQEVVREAGTRALEIANNGFDISIKPDASQVTTADLEVDRLLKGSILSKYPHDGWLSEESPDDRKRLEKRRVWILDPIDGTRNFISKIPQYAISIALVDNQELTLGVIFNPATNEMFSATKGKGAYLNGRPIHVKETHTDQLLCLANVTPKQRAALTMIEPTIACQAFGSIAYALALQAAGRVDMTLNPGSQNEWDIAAGVLLIREAGGTVADRNWHPIPFNQSNTTTQGVIATRPDKESAVRQLLSVLYSP